MSITSYHRRRYNNFHPFDLNEQLFIYPLPIQKSYSIDSNHHETTQGSFCSEYLHEGLHNVAPENEPIASETCYQGRYYKPAENHNLCSMHSETPNNGEMNSDRGVYHQKIVDFYKGSEYFGFTSQINTNDDLR